MRQIDAAQFAQAVEREARLARQASLPRAVTQMTRAALLQEFFGGDAALLELAERVGMPKPSGFRFGRNSQERLWKIAQVQEWADAVRQIARALGNR